MSYLVNFKDKIKSKLKEEDEKKNTSESVNKEKRYQQIIEVLTGGKKMTAKEIAVEMYNKGYIPTTERNFTAPRLTELSYKGIVEPIGKTKCRYTGRMVSVFKLIP